MWTKNGPSRSRVPGSGDAPTTSAMMQEDPYWGGTGGWSSSIGGAFYHIDGMNEDPVKEAVRVSRLMQKETLDVGFIGIGENGHIAFNDPPADFDTDVPFLVVDLDERCRLQQIHEGWFKALDEVPEEAISMSVRQIMSSKHLVCTVPEARKAEAVQRALEGKVNAQVPASILQHHEDCRFYLDQESSSLLKR